MLIKVRKKSQITLPADAMSALHLTEGSLLEGILEKDYLILLPCGRNSSIVPTQKKSVYFPPAVVSHGFTMQCFGRFRLYYEGSPVPLSRKAGEFLALLACERGGPLPKRTAASLLWPDSTDIQAVNSLSHLFRRINKLPYPIPLQQDKKTSGSIWISSTVKYTSLKNYTADREMWMHAKEHSVFTGGSCFISTVLNGRPNGKLITICATWRFWSVQPCGWSNKDSRMPRRFTKTVWNSRNYIQFFSLYAMYA